MELTIIRWASSCILNPVIGQITCQKMASHYAVTSWVHSQLFFCIKEPYWLAHQQVFGNIEHALNRCAGPTHPLMSSVQRWFHAESCRAGKHVQEDQKNRHPTVLDWGYLASCSPCCRQYERSKISLLGKGDIFWASWEEDDAQTLNLGPFKHALAM